MAFHLVLVELFFIELNALIHSRGAPLVIFEKKNKSLELATRLLMKIKTATAKLFITTEALNLKAA